MVRATYSFGILRQSKAGFSLVELLVVMGITVFLTTALLFNFRSSASNAAARHQISSRIVADLRRAQSMTASGTRYQNRVICGYGLSQTDSTHYIIYVDAPTGNSCGNNRNYQNGQDVVFETENINNPSFVISGPSGNFSDIFFQAPGAQPYLNNQSGDSASAVSIQVYNYGQTCIPGTNCTTIIVNPSGGIDINN